MLGTGEVTVIYKENEWDVEWKIQEYLYLLEENDTCYWSPYFYIEGVCWYLYIWSNGNEYTDTVRYIDMKLHRGSLGPSMKVELSFALKTVTGKKALERQSTAVFKGCSEYHINRFMSKSEYVRRQREFFASGYLTIVCTLKRSEEDFHSSSLSDSSSNDDLSESISSDKERDGDSATAKCFHCKEDLGAEFILLHEECVDRLVMCADCSDVVPLQSWLYDHECQERRKKATTNTTQSFVVYHHSKILQDIKEAFLKQENCDVILKVKGREFQAHKFILAARSPVFAATFRSDMKEKESGIVDIEDCDPFIFPDFLCYLYSEYVDSLSDENVFGLFTAADKYDIPDLRKMCLEFMKENLSVKTVCETLTLALQHTKTELIQLTTDFFIKNAEKILVTVKWQSFAAENPTQSNELFIKFVASDRCLKS